MTCRRGYKGEKKAKDELENEWGAGNCIKVAIGGAEDYIVVSGGELIKVIEVKEIHITSKKKKWYPSQREKEQMERIIKFSKQHFISAEIWIYKFAGTGKPVIKEIQNLYEPK